MKNERRIHRCSSRPNQMHFPFEIFSYYQEVAFDNTEHTYEASKLILQENFTQHTVYAQ